MSRLAALDVLLWIASAVAFFAYGQWIIALVLVILAVLLLGILTGGQGDGFTIFDIFD